MPIPSHQPCWRTPHGFVGRHPSQACHLLSPTRVLAPTRRSGSRGSGYIGCVSLIDSGPPTRLRAYSVALGRLQRLSRTSTRLNRQRTDQGLACRRDTVPRRLLPKIAALLGLAASCQQDQVPQGRTRSINHCVTLSGCPRRCALERGETYSTRRRVSAGSSLAGCSPCRWYRTVNGPPPITRNGRSMRASAPGSSPNRV